MPRLLLFRTLVAILLVGNGIADVLEQRQHATRSANHESTVPVSDSLDKTQIQSKCQTVLDDGTCVVPSNLEECGIWLAPSSIPGAGLGMYAGKDFKAGDNLQASGDIVIALVDLNSHQFQLGDDFFLLWDEYTWGAVRELTVQRCCIPTEYTPTIITCISHMEKLHMLVLMMVRVDCKWTILGSFKSRLLVPVLYVIFRSCYLFPRLACCFSTHFCHSNASLHRREALLTPLLI